MGLFSFIKDAGAKIFGSKKRAEEEAAKKAAADNAAHDLAEKKQDEYEERKGSELESLVNVTWGLGIQGLQVEVDDDTATIYGSTDSRFNKEMYGDGGKYHQIFEANKPMLKDVNEIYPGQVLRIPA